MYSGDIMKSEEYFEKMRETSIIVNPLILQALEPLKKTSIGLHDTVAELPMRRVETSSKARAFLLREAYEFAGASDWERIAPICAAVELELCSMYYVNRVYDDKGGERDENKISSQIMAAKITRDLTTRIIEEQSDKIRADQLGRILHTMNESDLLFETGQYVDVFENIYSRQKNAGFEEMLKLCDRRLYLINAAYFEKISLIGGILAEASQEQLNSLTAFGKNYGLVIQIVNDIADFVPPKYNLGTSEKLPTDAYSDVKHGKLTYPIIYTLHNGSSKEKDELVGIIEKGSHVQSEELAELTQLLMRNGSIDFAKKQARAYSRQAKSALKKFSKEKRETLSRMCALAYTNRFYKALLRDMSKTQTSA